MPWKEYWGPKNKILLIDSESGYDSKGKFHPKDHSGSFLDNNYVLDPVVPTSKTKIPDTKKTVQENNKQQNSAPNKPSARPQNSTAGFISRNKASAIAVFGLAGLGVYAYSKLNTPLPPPPEDPHYVTLYRVTETAYVRSSNDIYQNNVINTLQAGSCVQMLKPTMYDDLPRIEYQNDQGSHDGFMMGRFLEVHPDYHLTPQTCKADIGPPPSRANFETYKVTQDTKLQNITGPKDPPKEMTIKANSCVIRTTGSDVIDGFLLVEVATPRVQVRAQIPFDKLAGIGPLDWVKGCHALTDFDLQKIPVPPQSAKIVPVPQKATPFPATIEPPATQPVVPAPSGKFDTTDYYVVTKADEPIRQTPSATGKFNFTVGKGSCVFRLDGATKNFALVDGMYNGNLHHGYIAKSALQPADNSFSFKSCQLVP